MDNEVLENLCYMLWNMKSSAELKALTPSLSHPSALQYAGFVVAICICIFGFIANIVVIFVTGFLMKKNKYKIWFLNLALADLIFVLFLPLHAMSLFRRRWLYGSHVCKLYNFLFFVNMYASIYILTALNIDRALSVAKPIWHLRFHSKRFCWSMCAVIWVSSALCSIPAIIYSDVHEESQCTLSEYDPTEFAMSLRPNSELLFNYFGKGNESDKLFPLKWCAKFPDTFTTSTRNHTVKVWRQMTITVMHLVVPLAVFGYGIPLYVILSSSIIIAIRVKNSKRASSSRLYKVVFAAVMSFFCTRTPYVCAYITFLVSVSTMRFTLMYKLSIVLPLLSTIAATNSFLNPVVYVLIGKQVKSEIMNFVGRDRYVVINIKKRERRR